MRSPTLSTRLGAGITGPYDRLLLVDSPARGWVAGETPESRKGLDMPKEVIQHGDTHRREGDNSVSVVQEPSLTVAWNRDMEWVQVQLIAEPETWGFLAEDNCPTATSNVLSRKELNHLIRTLRRARDAAYGSDE